jgi:hypothetical protein
MALLNLLLDAVYAIFQKCKTQFLTAKSTHRKHVCYLEVGDTIWYKGQLRVIQYIGYDFAPSTQEVFKDPSRLSLSDYYFGCPVHITLDGGEIITMPDTDCVSVPQSV